MSDDNVKKAADPEVVDARGEIIEPRYFKIDDVTRERFKIPRAIDDMPLGDERTAILWPFALAMYCEYLSPMDISRRLGLHRDAVYARVKRDKWTEHRKEIEEDLLDEVYRRLRKEIDEVAADAIEILGAGLRRMRKNPELLEDPKFLYAVSQIFSNLKPALRIANGEPQNSSDRAGNVSVPLPQTAADVRRIMESDPFIGADLKNGPGKS